MSSITIEMSEPIERQLRARIGASGKELSAVVLDLVVAGLGDVAPSEDPNELPIEEWLRRFHAYCASRPDYGVVVVDYSRETIYEGRGE